MTSIVAFPIIYHSYRDRNKVWMTDVWQRGREIWYAYNRCGSVVDLVACFYIQAVREKAVAEREKEVFTLSTLLYIPLIHRLLLYIPGLSAATKEWSKVRNFHCIKPAQ